MPLLSAAIGLPLLAAPLVGLAQGRAARALALPVALAELTVALAVVRLFDPADAGFQMVERHAALAAFNIDYFIGIDGLSVMFLPLTALLTLMILLISPPSPRGCPLLLAWEGMAQGLYCALDTALFCCFWAGLAAAALSFLRREDGSDEGRHAVLKYGLSMAASCLLVFIAVMILAFNHAYRVDGRIPRDLSFDLQTLLATPVSEGLQPTILSLLVVGFAITVPVPPFHTWLPALAARASPAAGALLIGLKPGLFGLMRWALPLTPAAAVEFSWPLGILGGLTLLYCALIALRQTRLDLILVYAAISQTGLALIGIASLTLQGLQGVFLVLLNFVLIDASLLLIAGRASVGQASGDNRRPAPLYTVFLLAALALPGTSGFPAELLLIVSALSSHPGLGLTALLAMILKAVFMRPFGDGAVLSEREGRNRRMGLAIPLILIVAFGFAPDRLLQLGRKSADAWLNRLLAPPEMDFSEPDSAPEPEEADQSLLK